MFGSEMSAADIAEVARDDGVTVEGWLREEYKDLCIDNPEGWASIRPGDEEPNFAQMAAQIEKEVQDGIASSD